MLSKRFTLRTLIVATTLLCIATACMTSWYRKSSLQYNAIAELLTVSPSPNHHDDYPSFHCSFEYEISKTSSGEFKTIEPIPTQPNGINRLLCFFFDKTFVCKTTQIMFRKRPTVTELELVRQLKGVEHIILHAAPTEKDLYDTWRAEFPKATVCYFGQDIDWSKVSGD